MGNKRTRRKPSAAVTVRPQGPESKHQQSDVATGWEVRRPSYAKGLPSKALPEALSETWVVLNEKILASRRAAEQRLLASRRRVEALRTSIIRRRIHFQNERKKKREAQVAARLLVGLGSHDDTLNFTLGAVVFGAMAFIAGAAPGAMSLFYVSFFAYMMPARTAYFVKKKWQFFLLDFCYWANTATAIFLLFYPESKPFSALVFAMNEGPLSGALVIWQCAWVFGSREHTFSTLMHLLPGLAVHCNRFYPAPKGWRVMLSTVRALSEGSEFRQEWSVPRTRDDSLGIVWHFLAPLLFYCVWQLVYFVVVQLLFRRFIRQHGYHTSYTMLAQRAAKSNNFWHRFVRRGSPLRRISLFGGIQLAFTVATVLLAWPMFYSYRMSLAYQLVKIVVSLYYGSRMQCQVLPEKLGRLKIERYAAEIATAAAERARSDGSGLSDSDVPAEVPQEAAKQSRGGSANDEAASPD
eukprot:CAMPEP_0177585952 /NCGR_PEP_ID=MMETSP0419_2-20121207/4792_1 /TAXON_ID=582737 /ORGANISM="Tetraselmis sp., Strain GSL018" /LENGTH=465 /DNA_ID=CAMNT_0019075769 /DNA_START=82 /DNA_END=1479 /DNA_ORIENTATION=-